MSYYGFRPYVPVVQRRLQAIREVEKLKKKGQTVSPVAINGRKIAESFWGKAWCDNLERYSDYANRLPRGRTYVRNGSVVDLQIERGLVRAMVSGSSIYKVKIDIGAISRQRWRAIVKDCAGSIGSLVELLSGKLSTNVMERVCREGDGLFPAPAEIKMSCSCPDWAGMCKHAAATLYGAGARLDAAPDLLFCLRGVDRTELIAAAGADLPMTRTGGARERILADDDVAALFGVDMAPAPTAAKSKRKDVKTRAKSAMATPAGEEAQAPAPKTRTKPGAKRASSAVPPAAAKQRQKSGSAKSSGPQSAPEKPTPPKTAAATIAPKTPKNAVAAVEAPPRKGAKTRSRGRTRAAKWIKPRPGKGR